MSFLRDPDFSEYDHKKVYVPPSGDVIQFVDALLAAGHPYLCGEILTPTRPSAHLLATIVVDGKLPFEMIEDGSYLHRWRAGLMREMRNGFGVSKFWRMHGMSEVAQAESPRRRSEKQLSALQNGM